MKVLLLNANIHGIGTFTRALHFGRALALAGHSVTLCTVSPDNLWRTRVRVEKNVKVVEMPRIGYKSLPGWGSGWLDIYYRIQLILRGDFELVYGFEYQPNVAWPVYFTKKNAGFRFVSDWCDWYAGESNSFRGIHLAHQIDAFFEERIRFQAEKVTVISTLLRDRAIKIGIPSGKIIIIKEGVDTQYMKPMHQIEMRKYFGIPEQVPIITTITDKDMHIPIMILNGVRKQVPETKLLVIGQHDPALADAACNSGLEKEIIETGYVSDDNLPRYLACSDLCFLPMTNTIRNQGRWPQKINDFLAAGKATVISPVGDVVRIFQDYPVGSLANSTDEFVDIISSLLRNPAKRIKCEQAARQSALEQLSWDVLTDKITGILS